MSEPAPDLYELFSQVVGMPSEARQEFLDDLGRRAPRTAEELRELLAQDEDAGPMPARITSSPVDEFLAKAEDARLAARNDRYETIEELSRKGGVQSFRVRDRVLGRELALHVAAGPIPSGVSAVEIQRRRLLRESSPPTDRHHPTFLPIEDSGVTPEGRPFVTTPLVEEGQRLDELLSSLHRPNALEVATILVQVAQALGVAHEDGIVHRDVRSHHVLVGEAGAVFLVGWGSASVRGQEDRRDLRILRSGARASARQGEAALHGGRGETPDAPLFTADGETIVAPHAISPEQACSRVDEIGPATDVYALGAILYEVLAGAPPYDAGMGLSSARAVHRAIVDGPPRPLRQLVHDAPSAVVAVCERAMTRAPRARYGNGAEFARALRAALADGTGTPRRGPSLALIALLVLAAAILGFLAFELFFDP